jgi:RNA polymerase sigma-70 factor, ECF subfamily
MFILFALLRTPSTDADRMEDQYLLKAIAMGDASALGKLYDRYGRLVYSLAYQIVYDDAIAEDITQEVFLQVWNKADSYQIDLGKVSTWLTSVARHRAIDSLRRSKVRPESHKVIWDDSDDADGPEWIDPQNIETQVELTLQGTVVRQAISQLPKEQRQALAMAYFQGLSHQEIAESTGEPLGTIKTRIRLAMHKLREALEASLR